LTDSPGDDNYVGTPTFSYLAAASGAYFNLVSNFAHVYAVSSTGNDTATLYDSSGNDTFYGSRPFSYLTGTGFFNQVASFFQVSAFSQAGKDTANLYDALHNDVFVLKGPNAELYSSNQDQTPTLNYDVLVYAFSLISANDVVGSNDQLFLPSESPPSFLKTGSWTAPPLNVPPPPPPANRNPLIG
jgi:hypothetical protein